MHSKHSIYIRLSSVFLVAIMLFGITGFTIQKHICNCKNEIVYSVFPEILGSQINCCCSLDKKISNKADQHSTFSNPDGCKNIHFFYKDPSITVLTTNIILDLKTPAAEFILNSLLLNNSEASENEVTVLYKPPPLLYYGQSLLRLIHRFNIPSSEM